MKTIALTAATATLLGTTALAGPIDDIVSQFQGYGYSEIEIRQEGDLVKIEGVRDGTEREILYDVATSTIVSDETGPVEDDDDDDEEDYAEYDDSEDDESEPDDDDEEDSEDEDDDDDDDDRDDGRDEEDDEEDDD